MNLPGNNLEQKVQTKGMEMQARSKHQQHYRGRRRTPAKVKLFVLLVFFVAFFWWVYS